MPTPVSGAISFVNIKDNFINQTNSDGFAWGSTLANLYTMSYYRGRAHLNGRFPSSPSAISFSDFYNTDGSGYVAPPSDGGGCFLIGSPVIMADGSIKNIEDVSVGEYLLGAFGEANEVLALNRPLLRMVRSGRMVSINGRDHVTTLDHAHLRPNKTFAAVSLAESMKGKKETIGEVILEDGTKELWLLPGFKESDEEKGIMTELAIGEELWTTEGNKKVESITPVNLPGDTQLHNFVVGGSHTYFVNGYCVSGFVNGKDFDYFTWTNTEKPWDRSDYFRSKADSNEKK